MMIEDVASVLDIEKVLRCLDDCRLLRILKVWQDV